MDCKMHTHESPRTAAARISPSVNVGRWLSVTLLALTLAVALLATIPSASASEQPSSTVTVTTDHLPSDFTGILNRAGLVLAGTESLDGLGLVIVELRIAAGQTADIVFDRLRDAFPGHIFERFEDTADFETSAF